MGKLGEENTRLLGKITALNSEVGKLTNERLDLESNVGYLRRELEVLGGEKLKREE